MNNFISFLSYFVSYLLLFLIFMALVLVACMLGIKWRKVKNEKQLVVAESTEASSPEKTE